ncbi:retron St85 family RNA-directed DNA polymerase [Yersinia enterocolitica]
MNLFGIVSNSLFLSDMEIRNYVSTIPRRYKRYSIPKRNGIEFRIIAQPAKQVKVLQRIVLPFLQQIIPIHGNAHAYEKNKSIKTNALVHSKNEYLLKMDFKNFFLSIKPNDFIDIMKKHEIKITDDDKFIIENLFFWKLTRRSPLRLSIGAPSSPFISNAVMYFFDEIISHECEALDVKYTRYADDLTFSTNVKDILFLVPKIVKGVLKSSGLKNIKINTNKTVFSSKKFNRHVTGITLTNDGEVSLGRERKRVISVRIHYFTLGLLSTDDILKLKGDLGFAKFIEPEFIHRMERKYGLENIEKLRKFMG